MGSIVRSTLDKRLVHPGRILLEEFMEPFMGGIAPPTRAAE
jgi:hypothetical protein